MISKLRLLPSDTTTTDQFSIFIVVGAAPICLSSYVSLWYNVKLDIFLFIYFRYAIVCFLEKELEKKIWVDG